MNRREFFFFLKALGVASVLPSQVAFAQSNDDPVWAMNTMARQRMLSNRVTKGYLMMAFGHPKGETIRDQAKGIMDRQFLTELGNYGPLSSKKELSELYKKAKSNRDFWMPMVAKGTSKEGLTQLFSASETTLWSIDDVVKAMVRILGLESAKYIHIAGLMRMYPQRSAKYYFGDRLGATSDLKSSVEKMKQEYLSFEKELRQIQINFPGMREALDKVVFQWRDLQKAIDLKDDDQVVLKSESILGVTEEMLSLFSGARGGSD